MAIDYYGMFPCKVREAISDADLLHMEKARNRANTILELMRKDPRSNKDKPESEWSYKTVVLRPEGPQETEVKISDALAEAAPLAELSVHCAACYANLRAVDFGCGGAIHYPIDEQAEKWLLSRLPADISSLSGKALTMIIADSGIDGSGINAARSRKDLYSSDHPMERTWGGMFSRKTRITSSQILEMSFAVGHLSSDYSKLLAHFIGFANEDYSVSKRSDNLPLPGDNDRIIEMKMFYSIVALAGANNAQVFIDS